MTARIYVGTYAKYNAGSIAGAWLDLEDYTDAAAFLKACYQLHKDEEDPELMFQDYEGFPASYYSESCIKSELWDWLELDEEDQSILEAYQKAIDANGDIDDARDAYHGTYDNAEDWAANILEETGALSGMPENLRNYFDYEAYARDCGYEGWQFVNCPDGVMVFSP